VAFPQIQGTPVDTATPTLGTSHTIDLPTGIAAGEKLLFVIGLKAQTTDTPITFDTLSATQIAQHRNGVQGGIYVFVANATGSEGASTNITIGTATRVLARVARVTKWTGNIAFAGNSATSANPDPPNVTPPWGAKDTLWFAFGVSNLGSATVTAFPASYSPTGYITHASGTYVTMGYARRELNAASENPGTFTFSTTNNVVTLTFALEPSVETLRPTAVSGLSNLTGSHTDIDQDPDETITDVGLAGSNPSGLTNGPEYVDARALWSGSAAHTWTSEANALNTSETDFASYALAANTTDYTDLWSFNAADWTDLPADAVITGVTIESKWRAGTASRLTAWVQLATVNGTLLGTEQAVNAGAAIPTTAGGVLYSNAHSGTMPTRAELVTGTFGVRTRMRRSNTVTAELYAIKVTVTYSRTVNTQADVAMGNPIGALATGAATGEIRGRISKTGTGSNPQGRIEVRNAAGTLLGTPIADTTITESDPDGQIVSGTFNQSIILDKDDVVLRFVGTGASGGLSRLIAVEWNAQIADVVPEESTRTSSYALRTVQESSRATSYALRSIQSTQRSTSYALRVAQSSTRASSYALRVAQESARASTYAVRAVQESSRASSYAVRSAQASTRSTTYALRSAQESARSSAYIVAQSEESARSSSYTLRHLEESTRSSAYTVRVEETSSLQTTYSVRAAQDSTRTTTYAVVGAEESVRSSAYAVRVAQESSRDSTYAVRVVEAAQRQASYALRVAQATSRTSTYALREAETSARSSSYEVFGAEESARTSTYALHFAESTERESSYSVLHAESSSRQSTYAVRSAEFSTRATSYVVSGAEESNRSSSYALRTLEETLRSSTYALRTVELSERDSQYAVFVAEDTSRTTSYALLAAELSQRTASYELRALGETTRSSTYALRSLQSSSRTGDYAVRTLEASQRSTSYALRSVQLSTRTSNYQVQGTVAEEVPIGSGRVIVQRGATGRVVYPNVRGRVLPIRGPTETLVV
jgi:hypothetical protein